MEIICGLLCVVILLLWFYGRNLAEKNDYLYDRLKESERKYCELENEQKELMNSWQVAKADIESVKKQYNEKFQNLEKLRKAIEFKTNDIPVLARFVSDLSNAKREADEKYLLYKKNPAVKSAEIVRELRVENKELAEKLKIAEYKVLNYERIAPWLLKLGEVKLDALGILECDDVQKVSNLLVNAQTILADAKQEADEIKQDALKKQYEAKNIRDIALKDKETILANAERKATIIQVTAFLNRKIELEKELQMCNDILKQKETILSGAKQEADEIKQDALKKQYEAKNIRDIALKDKETILTNAQREADESLKKAKLLEKECNEKLEKINLKVKDIPVLAAQVANISSARFMADEHCLLRKKNHAVKAAEVVRELREENRILKKAKKIAEYKALYYEHIVPWLVELEDEPLDNQSLNDEVFNKDNENTDDSVGYWVTSNEYRSLSVTERNQLALDRYCRRNKSKLEIGSDYERFIGYTYEKLGYDVQYRGIIDGFEDMGRDLICERNGQVKVIQCKYWSSRKMIHENHINQLFGTTLRFYLERNPENTIFSFFMALQSKQITPILITSTVLSNTAKKFASDLGVEVMENIKIEDYPMIKCNISGINNEKIYHLPFDQQYDKVKIDGKGEFYALTVREAEAKGFRRAKKWTGSTTYI